MWIAIGIIILLLNVMFVVIDLRNDFIRKGTLLNAFAAGVLLSTLAYNIMNV